MRACTSGQTEALAFRSTSFPMIHTNIRIYIQYIHIRYNTALFRAFCVQSKKEVCAVWRWTRRSDEKHVRKHTCHRLDRSASLGNVEFLYWEDWDQDWSPRDAWREEMAVPNPWKEAFRVLRGGLPVERRTFLAGLEACLFTKICCFKRKRGENVKEDRGRKWLTEDPLDMKSLGCRLGFSQWHVK